MLHHLQDPKKNSQHQHHALSGCPQPLPRCSEFFQVGLDGPLGQVAGEVAGDPGQQVFGQTREEALVLGPRGPQATGVAGNAAI